MEEQCQCKQDKEKKKQLAEGHAKKQTATTSSVCRKLPMQDQLVNEEEEQVQIHLATLNAADSFLHDSKTLTQRRVMMECSAQSVVRKSHLVAKQRLCLGLIVTIVMLGCIHTVHLVVILPHVDMYVTLVPPRIKFLRVFQLCASLLYLPV